VSGGDAYLAMKLKTLRDLYIHELKDIYSAEKQITKALPKMAKAAKNEELAAGFEEHLAQTEKQIERLDEIFEALGVSSRGEKCKGMEGLLEEGSKMMEEDASPEVLDAALIAAAQKVEHYEISGYGTLRTYAEMLGEDDAAALLQETLDEEIENDEKLTELAESSINVEAETGESE
jgi:ferritin-like metal-binding protein YciE